MASYTFRRIWALFRMHPAPEAYPAVRRMSLKAENPPVDYSPIRRAVHPGRDHVRKPGPFGHGESPAGNGAASACSGAMTRRRPPADEEGHPIRTARGA